MGARPLSRGTTRPPTVNTQGVIVEIETSPRPRRRCGRVLTNTVYALVSLVALGFIVPAAFGLERYVIAGGSMTGSISRGSVVLEEVVPVSELREGDVITYVPPADAGIDNLVTHRVVDIDGNTLVFSSQWSGSATVPGTLDGGNTVVH